MHRQRPNHLQANQPQSQTQDILPSQIGAMIYQRIRQNLAQEYTQFKQKDIGEMQAEITYLQTWIGIGGPQDEDNIKGSRSVLQNLKYIHQLEQERRRGLSGAFFDFMDWLRPQRGVDTKLIKKLPNRFQLDNENIDQAEIEARLLKYE